MEEDFQFLLCERCQREATTPKLLPCLHTLCAECLDEHKPVGQCPVCCAPIRGPEQAPCQDNLLFANLQARLNTYRKIVSERDLVCNLCKGGAEFWCAECEEFLCLKCYEAHQWYLKQKSHETQRLEDLKKETAQSFLVAVRKSCNLFCAEPTHNNQVISIYCRGCQKPLCCSCALLDGEHYHAKLYSDIRVEIENRKVELSKVKEELVEKKRSYEKAHCGIHEQLQQLEKVQNETRDMIRKEVGEVVRWIQQKGDELLEKVDRQLCQEQEEAKKKLQSIQRIIQRMEAGERLVEKMNLFALDQEVIDMYHFIKESLEGLRKEKLMDTGFRIQVDKFGEVRQELQALRRRVKEEDAFGCAISISGSYSSLVNSNASPNEKNQLKSQKMKVQMPSYTLRIGNTQGGFSTSMISPIKRSIAQEEKSIQACPKLMKLESHECDAAGSSSRQEDAASSQQAWLRESTPENEGRGEDKLIDILENSPSRVCESEVASIVISSSEDTEDDIV